jgi:hypothetical protein
MDIGSAPPSIRGRHPQTCALVAAVCLLASLGIAASAGAANLRVMTTGLGSGTIASNPAGISCGATCDAAFAGAANVTLTATPAAGSTFTRWLGDCSTSGTGSTCALTVGTDKSVRAEFALATPIPLIPDLTPEGLAQFLIDNPAVNTAARFVAALDPDAGFTKNWLLMSRSESLQTGTATAPRFLLPSADAEAVFTLGVATHDSYPGSHPNAIEYMQWDGNEKNFRFHEIRLGPIPAKGTFPARSRGVSADEVRCFQCHSTNNVLNRSTFPGTDGIPPRLLKAKTKPNWDTYDSWGGLMSFNRDRLYQGSVEAEAFRKLLDPWTWRANSAIRAIVEQLKLQPVDPDPSITRVEGGPTDGSIKFSFDGLPPFSAGTETVTYSFDRAEGPPPGSPVARGGNFVTLHHSTIPGSDEGRGVRLFDLLGGAAGDLNPQRIADELIRHRFATGSVPIDVRPAALAITRNCLSVNAQANVVVAAGATPLTIDLGFFNSRNGMMINELIGDTRSRAQTMPRRKADIQKHNLDRQADPYLLSPENGLIQLYGAATAAGTDVSMARLRQEVFQRPIDIGTPDVGVMGGVYVDRELYSQNTQKLALYRYLLEPLGVSVDKWSMGVRGRSRTYSFADVFGTYVTTLTRELENSLEINPIPGLETFGCDALIGAMNTTLAALPKPDAVPTYTDVQRVFNRSCIECHGGLVYPPASKYFPTDAFNLAEDEEASEGTRLRRAHRVASDLALGGPESSAIMQRITSESEDCPFGMMPCGGPPLSKVDIETIRRWIVGGTPYTEGDPHITTVDGTPYDFQSAGEFVLLRDEDVEIQARQSPVETLNPLGPDPHSGLSTCVSLNTAVAIRVGRQRITYEPNLSGVPDPRGLQLRVDGRLVQVGAGGIALRAGGRILRTQAPGGIQIEAPGGTDVVVTPSFWDFHRLWYMNINVRRGRGTQGVMGAIAPGNWLPALPDGTLLGPRPESLSDRFIQLYQTFADAWRVDASNTLFDYAPGTSTDTFSNRDWPLFQPETCRLGEGGPVMPPLPPATAQQQCRGIVDAVRRANCVKDVMITGEIGFATTYVRTEQIQKNTIPTAPSLLTPEDNKIDVGSTVQFTWTKATDADGDPLTYRHCLWLIGETLTASKCRALAGEATSTTVAGLQPGKAYYWKVTVEDRNNGTAHSLTRRFATRATNSWAVGVAYAVGDRVLFNGVEYVCIQAHTSQADWKPDVVPALWNRVIAGVAWQPQTAYATGAVVTFGGTTYECIQGHTSQVGWEPPQVPALWRAR